MCYNVDVEIYGVTFCVFRGDKMTRTEFLREQTLSCENKCARKNMPEMSVADEPLSLSERKALATKRIFDTMPVYIGKRELIVGTRTLLVANEGNEDGHDVSEYGINTRIPYIKESEVRLFGCDQSYKNRTHVTPDFSIILEKGIDGIINDARERKEDVLLKDLNVEFLSAVEIAYSGLKNLILRYSEHAQTLADKANGDERQELLEISRICKKISSSPAESFHEAVQLLWFAHLGTIVESFEFVNYGRLDVILGKYLGDTDREKAQQLIECLMLKMHDQTDLVIPYLKNYSAQLVVTLGGVLPNGESAVNEVTFMFLEGIRKIRLPDPEFNLRISSKNPSEFVDKAAELTISGCNFVSYYNDDLFVESLNRAGVPIEYARRYGFDLCQDINIPGFGDFWLLGQMSISHILLDFLKSCGDFESFDDLMSQFKKKMSANIKDKVEKYNRSEQHLMLYAEGKFDEYFDGIKNDGKPVDRVNNSPMAPLPLLSGLYHGCIENALDFAFEPYPLKDKGIFFGTAVEAVNSLAAIKKTVFDEKCFTLEDVLSACQSNFEGERGEHIRNFLWNCPKWGNDDDYVDSIAKDILEYCLIECKKYKTYLGGSVLGGIHQPHPVLNGGLLPSTPDGRKEGEAVAVTLTPASGTMKNGPTAALNSAAKIDPMLVQWNFCVMVNYLASAFRGNGGKEVFKSLLQGYFDMGGLQHQPNVLDVETLKKAQSNPKAYKDLIVRLWGVSAHFVDLPRVLQDEMIARFS